MSSITAIYFFVLFKNFILQKSILYILCLVYSIQQDNIFARIICIHYKPPRPLWRLTLVGVIFSLPLSVSSLHIYSISLRGENFPFSKMVYLVHLQRYIFFLYLSFWFIAHINIFSLLFFFFFLSDCHLKFLMSLFFLFATLRFFPENEIMKS